jgi:saccharopine dehydrogenase (NAD+, L-lysine-forming)
MSCRLPILYIRKECKTNEYRTPIIPEDVARLLQHGFIVCVQRSNTRIYTDDEYKASGAVMTELEWFDPLFKDAYIIGLKELSHLDKLSNHKHIYFSHSYKNQSGAKQLLETFYNSGSVIYDFEYFLDENEKRTISFGFYAGIAGCYLGLMQYFKKRWENKNISAITPDEFHIDKMDDIISKRLYVGIGSLDSQDIKHQNKELRIAIVGPSGNCGSGVKSVLDKFSLKYESFDKTADKSGLHKYDIVYNCITLQTDSKEIWFSENTAFENPIVITDISCDSSKDNNPISIYKTDTTWENPVFSYNKNVDIIAISNLPSLLPKESSKFFSNKCVEFLLDMESAVWKKAEQIYYNHVIAV